MTGASRPMPPGEPSGRFGALTAVLACCGVKLVVLAALLAPSGFLTGEVGWALAGVIAAGLLLLWAVRRRRGCDGTCHVTDPKHHHRGGPRSTSLP
jgi:hypothetical protein